MALADELGQLGEVDQAGGVGLGAAEGLGDAADLPDAEAARLEETGGGGRPQLGEGGGVGDELPGGLGSRQVGIGGGRLEVKGGRRQGDVGERAAAAQGKGDLLGHDGPAPAGRDEEGTAEQVAGGGGVVPEELVGGDVQLDLRAALGDEGGQPGGGDPTAPPAAGPGLVGPAAWLRAGG